MWIYETMTAPVLKEGVMLSWDPRIGENSSPAPSYIQEFPGGAISQQDSYQARDAVVMATDTLENLPCVGFEARTVAQLVFAALETIRAEVTPGTM